MKITLLDKAKKKKFIQRVEMFGVSKIPQLLIQTGRERIRAYSGNLSNEEIMQLWRALPIEGIGLYVAKDRTDKNGVKSTRLSVDALHIWKEQIQKNIIELDNGLEEEWFKGKNVEIDGEHMNEQFVAVKSKSSGDFIGTGRFSVEGKTLYNFLPKERRRKSQVI